MKRRILLVDDEVAVLLTLKAVLEISGFDVDTATSAREGKHKLHAREYNMIITDMRMENEEAGAEVIRAAREAAYQPAIALLTAFPVADEDWQEMGADRMLVKPMHTRILIEQIETLMTSHENNKDKAAAKAAKKAAPKKAPAKKAVKTVAAKPAKKTAAKPAKKAAQAPAKKAPAKKASAKKAVKKK